MQGLLDFFTGGGDYADPTKIDPRYGVPMGDVRQAALNSIGNMGAILLAAGQRMEPQQRAAYLAQLGQASSGMNTDLYNAAQRRLMQAQYQTKMDDMKEDALIRDQMKDIGGFKTRYGFDPTGMRPEDVRMTMRARASRDPNDAVLRDLTIREKTRTLNMPKTFESGGVTYRWDEEKQQAVPLTPARPQGGLEGQNQQLIISAMKDPTIAESPEYAIAFNSVFGPKLVQAFNPETKQMEYTYAAPPLPNGVIPPRGAATQPAAPQAGQGAAPQGAAPVAAPAPGTTSPIISQRPPEPKALTEDQAKSTGFAKRMIEAHKITDPLDFTGASKPELTEVGASMFGPTAQNMMRSSDRQLYRQAQENWVRANLRKESGAVIGPEEMRKEIENYFPQIGDGPGVIEQKRRSREAATQGMVVNAGPGAERAKLEFKPYDPPFDIKIKALPPQELLQIDPSTLSERDKQSYLARLRQLNLGGRTNGR